MLQHYMLPQVCIAYLIAIGWNACGLLPITFPIIGLESFALILVDYQAHAQIHWREEKKLPKPPIMSLIWVLLIFNAGYWPGYLYGWQASVIFVLQALWDNSWHSLENHRKSGKPETHTDKLWIRIVAPLGAVAVIAIPHLH